MLSLYIHSDHWLQRQKAVHKLLGLLIISALVISLDRIAVNLLLLVLSVIAYWQMGIAGRQSLQRFARMLPYLLVFAGFAAWDQGFEAGLRFGSRIIALILCANLLTLTTQLDALLVVFEKFFSPLRYLGINPQSITLALGLMIRFIPTILARSEYLADAYRNRSPKRRLWHWRLFMPLVLQCLIMARQVGDALENRLSLRRRSPS